MCSASLATVGVAACAPAGLTEPTRPRRSLSIHMYQAYRKPPKQVRKESSCNITMNLTRPLKLTPVRVRAPWKNSLTASTKTDRCSTGPPKVQRQTLQLMTHVEACLTLG